MVSDSRLTSHVSRLMVLSSGRYKQSMKRRLFRRMLNFTTVTNHYFPHKRVQRWSACRRMIRGARAGPSFLRSATASSAKGRCAGNVGPAARRLGILSRSVRPHRPAHSLSPQTRFMSTAPSSLDEKKDAPEPVGFTKRVLGKESCVVCCYDLRSMFYYILLLIVRTCICELPAM